MATVARENIGLLNDKIIIKVDKDDYLASFEKKLKEYSKTVNIPGFRKGMVPVGMIKKMYGPPIYTDEILKTVEKELHTYLNTEKPDIFAQPIAMDADIRKLDCNNPVEYEFGFEIGLKPTFKVAPFSKANVTYNKVAVTEAMIQEEVDRMVIKGGKIAELETVENEDTIMTILFTEVDKHATIIDDGIVIENTVIVKLLSADAQKEFIGKKIKDTVTLQLSAAFEGDKLAAFIEDLGLNKEDAPAKKYFNLTIEKIGFIAKREINQELFKEVFPRETVTTEAEFRQKLKEEIEQYWQSQSLRQLNDQLYHYLLEETNMEFPTDFLKRWLQVGSEKRKTSEEAEEEFPVFRNQLKWTLITDKIIKQNRLDVSIAELKDSMKTEIMRYFGSMNMGEDKSWLDSYVDRMMKDEKQAEASYRRLVTDKLFAWAQSEIKPTEKLVTSEELTAMQHNHNH